MDIRPYQLNTSIVNALASIVGMVGRLEGITLSKPDVALRRKNRIRAIQSSLAIEGNSLTVEQVTAVLEGKRVAGPRDDILEVRNAFTVYDQLMALNPYALESLLEAHGTLMKGLVSAPGTFRKQPIGVIREKNIFHEAPPWRQVEAMMGDLFSYLAASDEHPILKSCRFHYQLEYIHPFVDGNGRMGRLWQTRILSDHHPIFEFLPVESLVRERQQEYYQALAQSDDAADCTGFVEFMLLQIDAALNRMAAEIHSVTLTDTARLDRARLEFGPRSFSRKEYQLLHKTISPATASRDLQRGVSTGLLDRVGDKRTAVYHFREAPEPGP